MTERLTDDDKSNRRPWMLTEADEILVPSRMSLRCYWCAAGPLIAAQRARVQRDSRTRTRVATRRDRPVTMTGRLRVVVLVRRPRS